MKVAHVFMNIRGGLQIYFHELIERLVQLDNDTEYILIENNMSRINNDLPINITESRFLNCKKYSIENLNTYVQEENGNILTQCFDSKAEEVYDSLFNKVNPDTIHFHSVIGIPLSIIQLAYIRGFKVIYSFHDTSTLCPKGSFFIDSKGEECQSPLSGFNCAKCIGAQDFINFNIRYNYALDILNNYTDRLISVSNFISQVHKLFGVTKKIDVIRTGTTLPRLGTRKIINKKCIKLLYVGGINVQKGFIVLLEAVRRLNSNNYILDIYGFENMEYFENEIKKNYKHCNINFKGSYKREDILEVFDNYDVLIFPSIGIEAFGMVVQEAASRNIPSIVSTAAGVSEQIDHNVNGWCFEKGNVTQLSSIIERLLINPGIIQDVSDNLWCSKLKIFQETAEKYYNIYQEEYNRKKERFTYKSIKNSFTKSDLNLDFSKDAILKRKISELNNLNLKPVNVYIFGTGEKANKLISYISHKKFRVMGFFDNNSSLWGSKKLNTIIEKPRFIDEIKVIIASSWAEDIYNQLIQMGYSEDSIIKI